MSKLGKVNDCTSLKEVLWCKSVSLPSDSDFLKKCGSVTRYCNVISDLYPAVTFRKHPGVLGGRYVGVRVSQPAGAGADRYDHYSICTVFLIYERKNQFNLIP